MLRSSGCGLDVSVGARRRGTRGEADLDERLAIRIYCRHLPLTNVGRNNLPRHPANLPLNQQLHINRAGFVTSKAMIERTVEPIQTEMFRASAIVPIQKRAMCSTVFHNPASVTCVRSQN